VLIFLFLDNYEDEEEEGPRYQETEFRFQDFMKRLPHPKIVRACGLALRSFETNPVNTNHCIVKLLHRIAFDCKMYVMVFQVSIFRTFQRIYQKKELPQHKELVKFAAYIIRQFFKVAEVNKKVYMEALFWKSSRDAYDIEYGYGTYQQQSRATATFWSEEQEDELRRLFMEHQQNNVEEAKPKANQNWTEEEEAQLQELYEECKNSDDPLGYIMPRLEVARPKNRIVEKMLVMGLIQDKKEVWKKRSRGAKSGGRKPRSQRASDDEDDDINSDSDSDSSQPAPRRATTKDSKKKRPKKKQRDAHVPASKPELVKHLLNAMESGMDEALDWFKDSLSDAIEDFRDGNDEGLPLVPIMDYAHAAMENVVFQQMLKAFGVTEPFDEQEAYWRIPGHLSVTTLNSYCNLVQEALDKTLTLEIEETVTQQDNVESEDDEDLFDKLKAMTKPPETGVISVEDAFDRLKKTRYEKAGSSKTAQISDTQPENDSNGQSNENVAKALGTSIAKKKSRRIMESDDDEDEDDSINGQLEEETEGASSVNLSKKGRNVIESDSEEENGSGIRNVDSGEADDGKRSRSTSSSDSEKPVSKRSRAIESDDE
ncbi:hypothetical protein NQ315_008564, partial [Exocentrus adspersus]